MEGVKFDTSRRTGAMTEQVTKPNDPWTFGDEPRVDATLRQPGIVNFDFAVFNDTSIGERMKFQFRAEFFNLTPSSPLADLN